MKVNNMKDLRENIIAIITLAQTPTEYIANHPDHDFGKEIAQCGTEILDYLDSFDNKQLADAKVENEKLHEELSAEHMAIYENNMKEVRKMFGENFVNAIAEARKEERARIVKAIAEYAKKDGFNDRKMFICAEIIEAITADQPTQKSCEGCVRYRNFENEDCPVCNNFSHYKAEAKRESCEGCKHDDEGNGWCLGCADFNRYLVREQ